MEPSPNADYRDLRTGYVEEWHIYSDAVTDGILAPGDVAVETMCNWWTPVSAHTQHNYDDGPYGGGFYYDGATQDMPSGPMNFASKTNSSDNYWLPQEENAVQFYMSYSQFDNNDFATFYDVHGGGLSADQKALLEGRNEERNGWSLAWLTHAIVKEDGSYVYYGVTGGQLDMDIFVHEGNRDMMVDFGADGMGLSRSNPQVSMSNDISNLAKYSADGNPDNAQWHPPTFDDSPGSMEYRSDSTVNTAYKNVLGLTDAEFDAIVDSMEAYEVDPNALGAGDVIWGNRRPSEILATLVDHNGDPYEYADAFLNRSTHDVPTNDGGVIAGLSGWDEYDEEMNNWGDQQVIRIDIAPESLLAFEGPGGQPIEKIIFYDFGCAAGSSQINPRQIVFNVDPSGNLYWDDGQGGKIYFPENRIYIARVNIVPEPGIIALLSAGSFCVITARRRRRS